MTNIGFECLDRMEIEGVNSTIGKAISEAGAYMSCSSGNAFFNSDLDYSCERIALDVAGECEAGREERCPCGESVTESSEFGVNQ